MRSLLSALNDPNHLIILICVGCVVVFTLKNWLLIQMSHAKSLMYFILYPGVVIHELSHLLFCILLGVRVKRFKLFDSGNGFVEYESERRSIVKDFLISIAPLLVGSLLLYLSVRYLPVSDKYLLKAALTYICVSVFLSMFPSKKDLSNALLAYIALFIVLVVFRSRFFSSEIVRENVTILITVTVLALSVINLFLFLVRRVWKLR